MPEKSAPPGVSEWRTSGRKDTACYELFVFRSLLEKLASVNQGNATWTWDHENGSFLIQAQNKVIEQYIDILTRELGESLCLRLERATIIVDLRPWKTNADKTSMRIGFDEDRLPAEFRGHTGLEDIAKLHFIYQETDPPAIKKALEEFHRLCAGVDALLEKQYEWMWEKHWREDGLAFAIIRTYTWTAKSSLVESEIERFNNLPFIKEAGLKIELSTYNRGSSFNVRVALNGLSDHLRLGTGILDVFDAHFSTSVC